MQTSFCEQQSKQMCIGCYISVCYICIRLNISFILFFRNNLYFFGYNKFTCIFYCVYTIIRPIFFNCTHISIFYINILEVIFLEFSVLFVFKINRAPSPINISLNTFVFR